MPEFITTPPYLDAQLKAYWRLGGDSLDETANNNDGTDTAITYSAANGKFGQGAGFNGTTSKIVLPNSASLKVSGNFSVGCWARVNAVPNALAHFFSAYEESGYASGWQLYAGATVVRMSIFDNISASNIATYTANVIDNVWRHYVGVVDTTHVRLYVNGVEVASTSKTFTPISAATTYPRIGVEARDGTDRYFFDGAIDDVFKIDRALTPAEILQIYLDPSGAFPIFFDNTAIA